MKRLNPLSLPGCVLLSLLTGVVAAQDPFADLFGGAGNDVPVEVPAPAQPAGNDFGFQEAEPEEPMTRPDDADIPREERLAAAEAAERQERIRTEARIREARNDFDSGVRAMQNNQWSLAVQFFDEALAKFKDVPGLQDIRSQALANKSTAFFNMAVSLYDRRREGGDLEQALQFLSQADEANPAARPRSDQLRSQIETYRERVRLNIEFQDIRDEDQYREARENIADLLRRGRQEMEIGDLDQAKITFERILTIDRYNQDAFRMLQRVAELRYQASRVERNMAVARIRADAERAWLPPLRVDQRGRQDFGPDRPQTRIDEETSRMEERMARIRIPEIRFQQANIRDVIQFLVQTSREQDQVGVNIIFLDPDGDDNGAPGPATPARPAADDPFAQWGAPAAPARPARAPGRGSIQPITLEVRDISLLDALKLVTEIAGLYYRVERNIVIIERRGTGQLVTRFYSVDPTLFQARTQGLGQTRLGGQGGAGADPFGGDPFRQQPAQPAGGEANLNEIFGDFGVRIPEGGSISYNQLVSQLVVTLPRDQFPHFEEVLRIINVQPTQVQIEARFVEVLQRDLEQIGFEWILRDDAELLVRRGPGPVGSRERIQLDASEQGFTSGLRFFNFDSVAQSTTPTARTSSQFNPLGDIASIRGVLTNPELQMVVHAIDQRGNSDLLSAPRVTTVNGVNAIIEVVNEIIYPTEFDVTQNDIQVQGGTGTDAAPVFVPPTVIPGGFETRQVGVILNVTPNVAPDNYTINLTMLPEIAELVDWIQYGTQVPIGDQVFVVNMPQPVFASRNVTTSMIVWDGHTVVMGGLIREDLVHYKDKIPLLGDLPLLGRLFRSEGTKSEKRNLLIFVTASLVDPAGNPVNAGRDSDLLSPGGAIRQAGGPAMNP